MEWTSHPAPKGLGQLQHVSVINPMLLHFPVGRIPVLVKCDSIPSTEQNPAEQKRKAPWVAFGCWWGTMIWAKHVWTENKLTQTTRRCISSDAQMMIYDLGKITQINYVLVKIPCILHHSISTLPSSMPCDLLLRRQRGKVTFPSTGEKRTEWG